MRNNIAFRNKTRAFLETWQPRFNFSLRADGQRVAIKDQFVVSSDSIAVVKGNPMTMRLIFDHGFALRGLAELEWRGA